MKSHFREPLNFDQVNAYVDTKFNDSYATCVFCDLTKLHFLPLTNRRYWPPTYTNQQF